MDDKQRYSRVTKSIFKYFCIFENFVVMHNYIFDFMILKLFDYIYKYIYYFIILKLFFFFFNQVSSTKMKSLVDATIKQVIII